MQYAIVAVIVLILDQAVKYWTNINLAIGATQSFIPNFIELTNVQNRGAAFSMLSGARWLFVGLTVIFTIGIIVLLAKKVFNGKFGPWMLVFILAGGIGNFIDRVFNGYVVDMFHFMPKIFGMDFPVFNVADIFITVGGILFCLWLIFSKHPMAEKTEDTSPSKVETRTGVDYIQHFANPEKELETPEKAPKASHKKKDKAPKVKKAKAQSKEKPVSKSQPKTAEFVDPFAEFTSAPSKKKAPAPKAATAKKQEIDPFSDLPTASAPSKESEEEYSLEDILSEFR